MWENLFQQNGSNPLSYPEDDWIRENINLLGNPPGTVLDAGCGSGRGITLLRKIGWKVIGVDNSISAVRIAKRKFSYLNDLSFVLGSLEQLPIENSSVDAILCLDVIGVVEDPNRIFQELVVSLKPRGSLMITFQSYQDETFGEGAILRETDEFTSFEQGGIMYTFFTEAGIRNIISHINMDVIAFESYIRNDPPHKFRPYFHKHHLFGCVATKR